MKTKQILIEARKLIENKDNWTQFVYARDIRGLKVVEDSPVACRFCLLGALNRVARSDRETYHRAIVALTAAQLELFPDTFKLTEVNDFYGHEAVLRLLDQAIKSI